MEAGMWYATKDDESWVNVPSFETEALAVAGAKEKLHLDPGEKFWVGMGVTPPMPLDAYNIHAWLESAAEDDGCPDGVLPYEISEEAAEELDELLSKWAEKHGVKPQWLQIQDVSAHTCE